MFDIRAMWIAAFLIQGCPQPIEFVVLDASPDAVSDSMPVDSSVLDAPNVEPDASLPLRNVDRVCAQSWETLVEQPSGNCAGRRLVSIDPHVIDGAVTLVADSTGSVIAYSSFEGFDSAFVRLWRVSPDRQAVGGGSIRPIQPFGEVMGQRLDITTTPTGYALAAYHTIDNVGEVHVHSIDSELRVVADSSVASGVGLRGDVSIASSSTDTVVGYVHTGNAQVVTARQSTGWSIMRVGAEDPLQTVRPALDLVLEPTLALVTTQNYAAQHTVLVYRQGESLSDRVVDRPEPDGPMVWTGISPQLAVAGEQRWVVYYEQAGRLVRVKLLNFVGLQGVFEPQVIAEFSEESPLVSAAADIRVDADGHVHLLYLARAETGELQLRYRRHIRGAAEMVEDNIATLEGATLYDIQAALALSADGAPHIVYMYPSRGVVYHTIEL